MSNNDNRAILNLNLSSNETKTSKFTEFCNGLFTLFYFIMKKPLDNFWFECISILIQYFQMCIFIIDSTVSISIKSYNKLYSFFQFDKDIIYYKKYRV